MPPPPPLPPNSRAGGASSSSASALQDVKQMRDKLQSLEAKLKQTRRDIEAGYQLTPHNSGPTSAPRRSGADNNNNNNNYHYKAAGGRTNSGLAYDPRTPPGLTVPTGAAMAGLSRTGSLGQRPASRLADSAKTRR